MSEAVALRYPIPCPYCHATGLEHYSESIEGGPMREIVDDTEPCPACCGSGRIKPDAVNMFGQSLYDIALRDAMALVDHGVNQHDLVKPKEYEMKFYRKKPVVIQAVQWLGNTIVCPPGPEWFAEAEDRGDIALAGDTLIIRTLEGEMRANRGDWIILGVKGEIYPCKPDIFAATYEDAVVEGNTRP